MTLTADQFLQRFLQHVLPRGFQKVRHYGFLHPRQRVNSESLKMTVTTTLNLVYVLLVAAKPLPVSHRPACPDCGGGLTYLGFLPAPKRGSDSLDTS